MFRYNWSAKHDHYIRSQFRVGAFSITTYIEGMRRFVSFNAVSQYLDSQHLRICKCRRDLA
ncbi:hypothetical protein SAMN04515620_11976 [Collimonas sp. OK607]|nr:hypothetical protein SAMN04515620_11976 [Collimonas sp. OK607]